MIKSPRQFILEFSEIQVEFEEGHLIIFYNKHDEVILKMTPAELSAIYGAFMQMCKENIEEEKLKDQAV